MRPGSSKARDERRRQAAIARELLLAGQLGGTPEVSRIELSAADMAQGPAHLVRLSEAVYNPRGVSLFVPPVGHIASLDEEKFFDRGALINPTPGKQYFHNGTMDGTFKLTSVALEAPVPVVVAEPVPVEVPDASTPVIETRSRRSGE